MDKKNELPAKYDATEVEAKWRQVWLDRDIFRWNPQSSRAESFVVDTPPPTVSGSLHLGHTFSYTHTDLLVRYMRMRGKNIMYPMGWDDNGLPTERRVQNKFAIACDATLPYDPNWKPMELPKEEQRRCLVSRRNFIEACSIVTEEDERVFKDLWQRLGLSVDWHQEYATVGHHCRHVSQLSFLDLVEKGFVYQTTAPTMWDVTFQSAIAQAELEDRELRGHFHNVRFGVKDGGSFTIATTRPELLAACIAVVAHPDDQRYQPLFGRMAVTPIFGVPVPILPSEHADPTKGTGIMMVCTFGDLADVIWWKSSGFPPRLIIGRDGRMVPVNFGTEAFPSVAPEISNRAYASLAGKTIDQARKGVVELLKDSAHGFDGGGAPLVKDPEPINHAVKFYEKGDKPIEFVASRQWYVRVVDYKQELVEQGRKIEWYPDHMRHRYEHWVNGLTHDWCISRQRFFGVPFPVWYPLDANGLPDYEKPIYADKKSLPIDPLSEAPPGYASEQRGKPNGFMGEPDVMDTWATSSLTPQVVSHWGLSDGRHAKLFPSDVRPQSHELIRTWAFYTIVKAWMHEREIPWKRIAISGWILDPDRKKMSKSKGNVVTPIAFLEKYSADAVRYWAARARLGADTAFDEKVFAIGRKLANKLFNASRFALMQIAGHTPAGGSLGFAQATSLLDRAWVARLQRTVREATASFDALDHAGALAATETAFWDFADNYLELVKGRAYQSADAERRSALGSLAGTLRVFLRLFAPFMPYVTEEMWQYAHGLPGFSSVHTAPWPSEDLVERHSQDESAYNIAVQINNEVRRIKGDAKVGISWPVARLEIVASPQIMSVVREILPDIVQATRASQDGVCLTESPDAADAIVVKAEMGTQPPVRPNESAPVAEGSGPAQ